MCLDMKFLSTKNTAVNITSMWHHNTCTCRFNTEMTIRNQLYNTDLNYLFFRIILAQHSTKDGACHSVSSRSEFVSSANGLLYRSRCSRHNCIKLQGRVFIWFWLAERYFSLLSLPIVGGKVSNLFWSTFSVTRLSSSQSWMGRSVIPLLLRSNKERNCFHFGSKHSDKGRFCILLAQSISSCKFSSWEKVDGNSSITFSLKSKCRSFFNWKILESIFFMRHWEIWRYSNCEGKLLVRG